MSSLFFIFVDMSVYMYTTLTHTHVYEWMRWNKNWVINQSYQNVSLGSAISKFFSFRIKWKINFLNYFSWFFSAAHKDSSALLAWASFQIWNSLPQNADQQKPCTPKVSKIFKFLKGFCVL